MTAKNLEMVHYLAPTASGAGAPAGPRLVAKRTSQPTLAQATVGPAIFYGSFIGALPGRLLEYSSSSSSTTTIQNHACASRSSGAKGFHWNATPGSFNLYRNELFARVPLVLDQAHFHVLRRIATASSVVFSSSSSSSLSRPLSLAWRAPRPVTNHDALPEPSRYEHLYPALFVPPGLHVERRHIGLVLGPMPDHMPDGAPIYHPLGDLECPAGLAR